MVDTVDRQLWVHNFVAVAKKLLLDNFLGDVALHEAGLSAVIGHLLDYGEQL